MSETQATEPDELDDAALDASLEESGGAAEETETQEAEAEQPEQPANDEQRKPTAPSADEQVKNLTTALRRSERQQRQYEERLNHLGQMVLQQRQAPPQQTEQEKLDAREDPLGAIEAMQRRLEAQDQERRQYQEQAQAVQQREQQLQSFGRHITEEYEQEFAQDHPDYWDAAAHLVSTRQQELTAFGYSQEQVKETIRGELTQLSANAVQRGMNPAEAAYNVAKQRGYRQASTAPQSLQRMKMGASAAKTIGGGGKAPGANAKDIARMSDAEFDAAFKQQGGYSAGDDF